MERNSKLEISPIPEYRGKYDACKSARNHERLKAKYRHPNTPHPLRYAHPILMVSGRVW